MNANRVTFHNDFHNKSVVIRVKVGETLSDGQIAKIKRELCYVKTCTCGTVRGEKNTETVKRLWRGERR